MKMNVKEMARKAGVSVATISRTLNPRTQNKVAPQTRIEIEMLARKYGYTPNAAARDLRQKISRTIGVVFPYLPGIFYSNYYNHILAGVSDYLRDKDYQFKILLLDDNKPKWDKYDFKNGERIDGLLVVHWFKYLSSSLILKKNGLPCVIINDIEDDIKQQFVGVDHYLGGQIAANYLFELGHRRIGVMSGPDWSLDNKQRVEGFLSFFRKKNINIDVRNILKADYLEDRAYSAADGLLRNKPAITAVFACNDQMAFGVIRRFKELGINCPQDISVIGFDDETLAEKSDPPLTTIHVPVYEIAQDAVRLMIDHLRNTDASNLVGVKYFPAHLVERQSAQSIK